MKEAVQCTHAAAICCMLCSVKLMPAMLQQLATALYTGTLAVHRLAEADVQSQPDAAVVSLLGTLLCA